MPDLAELLDDLDPQAERWMQNAIPEGTKVKCKFCQVPIPEGVAKCPNCKEIINKKQLDLNPWI